MKIIPTQTGIIRRKAGVNRNKMAKIREKMAKIRTKAGVKQGKADRIRTLLDIQELLHKEKRAIIIFLHPHI